MSSPNVDTLKAMKIPELRKLCIDSGIDEKVCKSSKTLKSDLIRLILASKKYEEELIIETSPKKKSVKKKTSPKKPTKKSPQKKPGKKPAVKKSPSKKPVPKRCDEKKGLCAKGRVCDADTGDCIEKPSDMKNLSHLLIDGRVIIGSKKILTDLKKKIGGDIITPGLKESPVKKSPKKPSPAKKPSKKPVKKSAKKPAKKSPKKPSKRCDDEDGSCDPGQLCSATSGKCIKDTKTARKDKSELIVDGRVIIGSKKVIEDLQKKLGGIISDVTPKKASPIKKTPSPVKKVKKPAKKGRKPVKKASPVKKTPSPEKPSPVKKPVKKVKKPVKKASPIKKTPSPVKKTPSPKKPSPEKKAKSPQKKKKVAFEKRCDSKDDYLKCGPDAVCDADTGKCMNKDDIPEDVERFTIHDDGVERSFVGSSGAIRQLKMILQPEEPARRLTKIAEEEEGEEEVIKLKQTIKKKGKGVKKSPSKLEFQKQDIYETFAKCLESLE